MSELSPFTFVTCQRGVETVVKTEIARQCADWKLAFSRPGFLTFKLPEPSTVAEQADSDPVIAWPEISPFIRVGGWSAGKIQAESLESRCAQFWNVVGEQKFAALHVWQRDTISPDRSNFDPGISPVAKEAAAAIAAAAPSGQQQWSDPAAINSSAGRGQRVLDCVVIDSNLWWIGWHRAERIESRWPGGVPDLQTPEPMVSRAYLKMAEALAWSRLPIASGERCVEIGSAPGGASQCLLDRGLMVMGVDPAAMAPEIAEHPHFNHVKKRGADLKRTAFRPYRWLMADMNIIPQATLDIVESIVCHRQVKIRGLLLTLKLRDWALIDEIPAYLKRIRSWGYREVRARQLGHNRKEICVAALESRSLRRLASGKRSLPQEAAASQPSLEG